MDKKGRGNRDKGKPLKSKNKEGNWSDRKGEEERG